MKKELTLKWFLLRYTLLPLMVVLLVSCDVTRTLSDNERLYTGARVMVEADSMAKAEKEELRSFAEALIRPRPNTKVLGIPVKLMVYQVPRLREKYGEAPVLYSRVDPAFTSRLIQNELDNRGFFRARVQYDTVQQGKKISVNYRLQPGKLYTIGSVYFPQENDELSVAINASGSSSLLKEGIPYSLELIKAERIRIDAQLKEQGFYYFNADNLLVQADSAAGNCRVDLKLILKPETPRLAYDRYFVRNIHIDPPQNFKKGVLESMLQFQRNSVYNRTNHNLALNRLVSMGTFQFVRNRFVKADTAGCFLDAIYTLTPFPTKSLQAEVSARTNSAGYSGIALTTNWSHRNIFKGGELLTVAVFGSMDAQQGQGTAYNLYRTGMEASVVWPRLVAPFTAAPSGSSIPKTKATLGYELQHRSQLYTKHQFNGSFGYQWKSGTGGSHRLMLADITYANPAYVSDYYQSLMRTDPGLIKSVERELIAGLSYSFEYTNTTEQHREHRFYSKSSVQTSAALLGLLTGVSPQQGTPQTVLGVPFSQFIRLEQEYRHFFKIHPAVELAGRVIAGVGLPYGNSVAMPYTRQFFIGGSNSLRAFPARSVGPGSFRSPVAAGGFLPDESGDLKLELNAELRTRIYKFLYGALFVDAGNVWLLNSSPLKPGGVISTGFTDELAIGTGAGIRFDFTMIVLRLDLAVPVHKPWLPKGNRWVSDEPDFGSAAWWRNNRMWNIAIGYPF